VKDAQRRLVRDGYDTIAQQYLAARSEGGGVALLPELMSRLDAGDTVLDAGCGAGVPVMTRLVDSGINVVGLDLSAAQLRLARSLVTGVALVHADLSVLPFRDQNFGGLVSYYAVIHVPRTDHRAVFSEFARVLRPGGVALLCLGAGDLPEDHDPESWLGAPMFWSHFDAKTNLEMLRDQGFDILRHDLVADPMDHGHHLFAVVSRPAARS
jgi:ubiquinone/menaquinone biosynthesis C-methylase UbiE